jgi:hypothetical protein
MKLIIHEDTIETGHVIAALFFPPPNSSTILFLKDGTEYRIVHEEALREEGVQILYTVLRQHGLVGSELLLIRKSEIKEDVRSPTSVRLVMQSGLTFEMTTSTLTYYRPALGESPPPTLVLQ